MSSSVLAWGSIGIALLIVLNILFTLARASLTGVRRQTLRDLAERGDKRAASTLAVAEESTRVILGFRMASILTQFLLAGLIALLYLTPLTEWLGTQTNLPDTWATLIVALILLPASAVILYVVGESVPELIAQQNAVTWATRLAPFANVVMFMVSPLVAIASGLRRSVAAPLGTDADSAFVTEEEIMTLVDAGEEEGSIEQEEKEMIYSIFQLDETLAREIMVPRIDIVAIEVGTPLDDALQIIINAGHSRIPVYEDSLDKVIGLLYAKDLLELWRQPEPAGDTPLRTILRSAMFVPESKKVSELLQELQAAKVHMAIVIDEYGGTAGVVTIEDIVEEIVGEIFDEYDEEQEQLYKQIGDDEYIVDARLDLDDFNRLLGTDLDDELGDTLAGFIYGQLGKVPEEGEIIETERLHIEVLSVNDRRIRDVRIKKIDLTLSDDDEDTDKATISAPIETKESNDGNHTDTD